MDPQILSAIEEAEATLSMLDAPLNPGDLIPGEGDVRPNVRIHADPDGVERRLLRVFAADDHDLEASAIRRAMVQRESRTAARPRYLPPPVLLTRRAETHPLWERWWSDFDE
ncbi:MAG: hypothetical protein ABIK09_00615 [Pseudomonadota bacterium]